MPAPERQPAFAAEHGGVALVIGPELAEHLFAGDQPERPRHDPRPTDASVKGEMLVDSAGVMWLCIADGTPGTWISDLAQRHRYLAPDAAACIRQSCRSAGKLQSGRRRHSTTRASIADHRCRRQGVPAEARAQSFGNITVTQEDAGGFATIWPTGAWHRQPRVSTSTRAVDTANAFNGRPRPRRECQRRRVRRPDARRSSTSPATCCERRALRAVRQLARAADRGVEQLDRDARP